MDPVLIIIVCICVLFFAMICLCDLIFVPHDVNDENALETTRVVIGTIIKNREKEMARRKKRHHVNRNRR